MFYAKQTTALKNGYTESVIVALDSKKGREVFIAAKPSFTAITSKEKTKISFATDFLSNKAYDSDIGLNVTQIAVLIDKTKTKAKA
jgi:hypothetical protein